MFADRFSSAGRVGEESASDRACLLQAHEWAMSSYRLASRTPGVPGAVLNDVALGATRLYPDAEAGKFSVPDDELAVAISGQPINCGLGQSLFYHE